ncbi:MAG: hypothetical protein KDD33_13520 [Bdellovibrionales bacterium]|nr:hypothetical protein [Bdellovibrionales bacterium]
MDYSKKQLVRKSFYRHPKSHFCKNLEPKNFGNAYLVIKKKDGKNKKNDTLLKIKIYLPPVSHEETLVKERQLKNEIGIIQKTLVNVKVPECIDFDRKDLLVEIFSLDSQTLIAKGVLNQ